MIFILNPGRCPHAGNQCPGMTLISGRRWAGATLRARPGAEESGVRRHGRSDKAPARSAAAASRRCTVGARLRRRSRRPGIVPVLPMCSQRTPLLRAEGNTRFSEGFWSRRSDLNRGPADYESAALPTELRRPGGRSARGTNVRRTSEVYTWRTCRTSPNRVERGVRPNRDVASRRVAP